MVHDEHDENFHALDKLVWLLHDNISLVVIYGEHIHIFKRKNIIYEESCWQGNI